MRAALPLLATAVILSCACATPGGLDRVPEGDWGGDHVSVAVQATGAGVELDCAHGTATSALALDAGGRFNVPGYFVQEHGGPAREDEQEDQRPARYVGSSDGHEIRFSIRLTEDGTTLGPFAATRGAPPRLLKCLLVLDPAAPPS